MFYFSTLLRHFEHTIDEVPDCIKQALNASKLLVQSSPHFLLPILTVLWFVGSVGKLTSMHENLWITKLHHHIVVVVTFWYTAGNEFQLVHMHLFVHFFAHLAFYPLILFCSRSKYQNLPLRTWELLLCACKTGGGTKVAIRKIAKYINYSLKMAGFYHNIILQYCIVSGKHPPPILTVLCFFEVLMRFGRHDIRHQKFADTCLWPHLQHSSPAAQNLHTASDDWTLQKLGNDATSLSAL